jgi:hypothetical protein
VDTDIYFETLIIYRLKQIIMMYSKMITGENHLLLEVYAVSSTFRQNCILKAYQQLPQKQICSLYFFILRDKTGGGIFTKKVNLHSAFGILEKGEQTYENPCTLYRRTRKKSYPESDKSVKFLRVVR